MAEQLPLVAVGVANLRGAGEGRLASIRHASAACATAWSLAYASHKLGHWPTQSEYADFWKVSERSAQREWAQFKRVFPGEESPERVARWMLSEASSRIEDQSVALTVTAPRDLVAA